MSDVKLSLRLRQLFAVHDMTTGKPWKRILEFAIPMLIGNLVQQLYNTVDSIVVGHYVGDNALAAVGSAAPILNLFIVLFVGVSVGVSILVSQSFGAKDGNEIAKLIGSCITLSILVSVVTMTMGRIFSMPLLKFLGTPDSIINWCHSYLTIFTTGIMGFAAYNIFSGILRGLGDSFSSLAFLFVAAMLNIALDIWFVAKLNLGVAGVALATVLSQTISAFLCLWKLLSMKDVFSLGLKDLKLNFETYGKIIKIGIPAGLTEAIFSVAMMTVQHLTNSFGEVVIACNVIVMRVDGFAMMPNFSFGQAMTTFTGQNVGAKKIERVHEGLKQGLIIAVLTSVTLTSLILIFGRTLFGFFTETTQLIDLSMRMMTILSLGYVAMSITQSFGGVIKGAGDTMTTMWISLLCTIGIRVPLAYTFAYFTRCPEWPNGRPESTFVSLTISWVLGAVFSLIAYKMGKWKRKIKY